MNLTAFASLTLALASSVVAYPITADNVNCRSGPGTSYSVVKSYKKGQDVKLSCQTTGTTVSGNNIWDKTTDGCFVADYYVKTGTSGFITVKCTSGSGGTPSAAYCKRINTAGINLITQWEGFVSRPKPDPIGLPTVGYGHLCQKKNCAEVKYKFPLTKTTARQLLQNDIPQYTTCLAKLLNGKVKLNDNQWAALTSWVFNVGCGNAKSSTLVKRLNQGENPNTVATQELPNWRKAGGKVLEGLVNRRKAEIKLFKATSTKQAFPKCQ